MTLTGRYDLRTREEIQQLCQSPGRVFGVIEPKDWEEKFAPLGLRYLKTDLPADQKTVIVELLSPRRDWQGVPGFRPPDRSGRKGRVPGLAGKGLDTDQGRTEMRGHFSSSLALNTRVPPEL